MKLSSAIGVLGVPFVLAGGAVAAQQAMVIESGVDEIRQMMRDRFPAGTRLYVASGADADEKDTLYSWELQTSKLEEMSTCVTGDIGMQQLRIVVLSSHDLKAQKQDIMNITRRAAGIFKDYMTENGMAAVPMDDRPDEISEDAWAHSYMMGTVADHIAEATGVTATIFTVQIPADALEGVEIGCNIPMSDMEDRFNLPMPKDGGVIKPHL